MRRSIIWLLAIPLMLITTECKKELDNQERPVDPGDTLFNMNDLKIPQTFNFSTSREMEITINGFKSSKDAGDIKYSVYLYNSQGTTADVTAKGDDGGDVSQTVNLVDVMNNLSAVQITTDPNFTLNFTIPSYYDTLYVVQNDMGVYQSMLVPINSNKMTLDFPAVTTPVRNRDKIDDPTDILYAVNSLSEMYSINPITGAVTMLPNLPSTMGGSWACAIDPIAEVLYAIGISYPYKLYSYDLNTQVWIYKGNTGYQGPRLAYNMNDGMLYYSFGYWMLIVNPSNGLMVSYYRIYGLHDIDGGDVVFADNGRLYISSESGLYKCEFAGGNTINAIRISADNLPNYPNSLTFDRNQELWWASNIWIDELNTHVGRTYIMDSVTGGFEERWSFNDNYIHDLATMPVDQNLIPDDDADNDGIIDFYDEYPNDPDRAYDTYTPSVYGWGSYAFEDLWPNEGDYDFNDLVLNYRYTHVFNSSDRIVETILDFKIKNVGGSYRNGFGIELDMDEAFIQSVTGSHISTDVVTLNGKGLEASQSKPVIMLFDDAWASYHENPERQMVIRYATPILADDFGAKNPFIFINGDRGREVHMADFAPTSLVNSNYFGTKDDNSNPATGRYYKNISNLPWGIDIIHDFVYLQEKVPIIYGYTKFGHWAESGGENFTDWYKDQDGYRNNQYLVY